MATRDEILRFLIEVAGEKDLQGLSRALEQVGEQAKGSEGEASKLAEELDRLTTAARGSAQFVRLTSQVEQLGQEFDDANLLAYNLKQAIQATEQPSAELTREFKKASAEIDRLAEAQKKATAELQRVGAELREAGVDVDKLADEQERLQREALEAAKALDTQARRLEYAREAAERNARALDAMGDAFQKVRANLNTVGARLLKVGAAATTAAAAFAAYQTGRFFSGAIESSAEFGRALAEVQAVSGATAEQMEQLRQVAISAAKDSGFTFVEAAGGLGELARATGDAETAIAALPSVLDLARAGGLEVARAAEIATTTLTQFGLSAEESGRVADVLARAANSTTSSVEQLGNSLSYAAPLARQLGLELGPTVAIIGALADQGFRGERAGTALRNVFSALADPTSKFSRALSDAGIESRDFAEVIGELSRRADGGKSVLLALDAEARPAILALARDGGAAIRGLTQDLANSAGQARETANIIKSDLQGAADAVSLEFDDLRQQLVQPLLEPLRTELLGLAGTLREFASSPEFAQVRDAVAQIFTAGIQAAKDFAAEVDFAEAAQRISDFADGAAEDFQGFADNIRGVVETLSTVGNALSIIIDAVETGVLAIATAVSALGSASAKIVEFQTRVLDAIPAVYLLTRALDVALPAAADKAAEVAGGLGAVMREFATRTAANFSELRAGIDSFGEATPEAAAKTEEGAARIEQSSDRMAAAGERAAEGLREVPEAAAEVGEATGAAADHVEGAADRIGRATETVAGRLTRLKAELEAVRQQLEQALNSGASEEEIAVIEQEFDRLTAAVARTERQMQKAGIASDTLAAGFQRTGSAAQETSGKLEQAASALGHVEAKARSVSISLGKTSQAFQEANRSIEGLIGPAAGSIAGYENYMKASAELRQELKRQREDVDRLSESLEQQLAQYDPLTAQLTKLQQTYKFVDESRLREIARQQQRLEDLKEQARQAKDEAEDVTRDLSAPPRPNSSGSGGGGTAAGGGAINITINGFVGSLDRGALQQLARDLRPYLRRLDDHSA
jgi:TP901 family phage tail tape measure protein